MIVHMCWCKRIQGRVLVVVRWKWVYLN